jgi:hypothetical protein
MKNITNYHDLVAEKHRLNQRLSLLKREMNSEIHEIKEKFRFITKIVGFVTGNNNHKSTDTNDTKKNSLLKMGAALGVDLLVGPRLAKAGLLTRVVVPPILRGITSNIHKIIDRFKKKK